MRPDPQTQAFLDKANANPAPPPGEASLEEFREAVEPFRALGFQREEVANVDDLTVPLSDGEEVSIRLYRPDAPRPLPVLVWAHGGSWVRVTVDLMDNHYRVMANRSACAIAAVDYHLSPESTFPTAIEEVYGAAKWIKQNSKSLGLSFSRIGIGGESSGGNIAAAAALVDRDRRQVGFVSQTLIAPVLDTRFESQSWSDLGTGYLLTEAQLQWAVEQYAPGVDRSDPLLSPIHADSLDGLPPTFVITGELDPLKGEGAVYAAALREGSVWVQHTQVPGLIHHAIMAPGLLETGSRTIIDAARDAGRALRADARS